MPRKPSGIEQRTNHLIIRVTKAELEAAKKEAALRGVTLSNLVREGINLPTIREKVS